MYPIVTVNKRDMAEVMEQLGTKPKFWYRQEGRRFLFKAEERGTGDDWAEKIACELCVALGVPHVHYELAYDETNAVPGVICENCAPKPVRLVLGNEILLALDAQYPVEAAKKYAVSQHTVEVVSQAINLMNPPGEVWTKGLPAGIASAMDVFAGYILLDAWIANQDRHHENWGALLVQDEKEYRLELAPTFDHGASLARNLSDEERRERLNSKDERYIISYFARRARSAFYANATDDRPISTMDAWRAFADRCPAAANIWLERLQGIEESTVKGIIGKVPVQRMSRVCRDFTLALLMENQRRLLEGKQ